MGLKDLAKKIIKQKTEERRYKKAALKDIRKQSLAEQLKARREQEIRIVKEKEKRRADRILGVYPQVRIPKRFQFGGISGKRKPATKKAKKSKKRKRKSVKRDIASSNLKGSVKRDIASSNLDWLNRL